MSTSNKYEPGEFGYWWTVTEGNEDIEGSDYMGDLNISHLGLTSLRGAPRSIGGGFYCHYNKLKSLEYGPEKITHSFYCENNNLTTLKNCPKSVGGDFYCNDNKLTDLANGPHEVGVSFECENNKISDPISEIIDNDIVAAEYLIARKHRLTFEELKAEHRKRAIKRQLGPFAITVPGNKL